MPRPARRIGMMPTRCQITLAGQSANGVRTVNDYQAFLVNEKFTTDAQATLLAGLAVAAAACSHKPVAAGDMAAGGDRQLARAVAAESRPKGVRTSV